MKLPAFVFTFIVCVASAQAQTNDLLSVSARATVGTGVNDIYASFIVEGSQSKQILIRGVGPSLTRFGYTGVLLDPKLVISNQTGTIIASNDGWSTPPSNEAAVTTATNYAGAFSLGVPGTLDAALVQGFNPGTYSMQLSGSSGDTGFAFLELYSADSVPRVPYVSVRTFVGTPSNEEYPSLNVDFVVGGSTSHTFLIRALGPELGAFGVTSYLAQPILEIESSIGAPIASNTGWGNQSNPSQISTAAASVGMVALQTGSADCALLVTLAPGSYIALVSGGGGETGVAMLEISEIDQWRSMAVAPTILGQPQSLNVNQGQNAAFNAVAVGLPPPTYQWKLNGVDIAGDRIHLFEPPSESVWMVG